MIFFERQQLFLVTGASSGIGLAVAQLLVKLGASVAAVGRSVQALEKAREQSVCPEAFHVCPRDLADSPEELSPWVQSMRQRWGKFSGLLSCAGLMYMDGLRNYSAAETAVAFNLHLHVPLLLAQALSDRRNCVGAGTSIVFIAAMGGVVPQVGLLSYGAAKAALIAAAKNLSKELGHRQIRVNCLSPALVRTPMTEGDYTNLMGYDVLATEEANYPLGLGQPEDVAHAAAFLLSPQARWISGQNMVLDGGRY